MAIFEGLEKFGLDSSGMDDLFGEEKTEEATAVEEKKEEQAPVITPETDYLLDKSVECVICDHKFKAKAVKTSKMQRLQPDQDLRPRFRGIDTLKYEVISCPNCGYTAINRYFDHLSSLQMKLIKESVCSKFKASKEPPADFYDYDTAMERYKLSLFNSVVKKASTSEKAYTCLKMSWLCRGKLEEMKAQGIAEDSESMKKWKQDEDTYYAQAYEGLTKAVASENFPICGMDQNTMDILLAAMSFRMEKYEMASRLISRVLTSRTANRNSKDRALDMKQELIRILKEKGAI